jgi:tetratricopeptide (TPR) repeat protein
VLSVVLLLIPVNGQEQGPPAVARADVNPKQSSAGEVARLYKESGSALESKDYCRAADLLEHLVKLDPGHSMGSNRLGLSYFEMNQLSQALQTLRRATELNPTHPYAAPLPCCRPAVSSGSQEAGTLGPFLSLDENGFRHVLWSHCWSA